MTIAFRIAAVQLALLSLGFGIAGVLGVEHAARTGQIWGADGGFPTYDPAGFERWGFEIDVIPAILAFIGACLIGVVGAILLWLRSTAVVGSILAIVATALQAVFWVAFDLPFGPPGGAIVVILVAVGLLLRRRRRT